MYYILQSKGTSKFQANHKKLTLRHHLIHSEILVKCTKVCLATCSPERLCWLQDTLLFSQLQDRYARSCNHYTSHILHRPLLHAREMQDSFKTVSGCFKPPSSTPVQTKCIQKSQSSCTSLNDMKSTHQIPKSLQAVVWQLLF